MATINLGAIKFNWKGAYNSGNSYAVDDVVSSGGNSYVCIQAHSTAQAVGNATAYWNIMSSAGTNGTNGTDISTTLTTQGDILYRDGSGLQRLPKGTAGQVLQMNSGATAPEYGTVSSDFVKIASVEATSGTKVSFNNVFTTGTYKSYQIHMTRFVPSSGAWLKFYWRDSGSDITTNYYWVTSGTNGTSGGTGNTLYKGWNGNYGLVSYWSTDNSYNAISRIYVGNPAITQQHKVAFVNTSLMTSSEIYRNDTSFSNNNSTVTNGVDGFSIELSNTSYSINNMDVEVYGIK